MTRLPQQINLRRGSNIKLYFSHVAPNPTKIRLYLAEKAAGGAQIPMTEVLIDLRTGEQNSPEHSGRNYFQSVPVLGLDDGSNLIESLPAIEYLEELYPMPSLVGRTAIERARIRQLERIAETRVLNPLARFVHSARSPLGLPPSPEIAESALKTLTKGLSFFEQLLADGRGFVTGEQPSIADCTLAAGLNFGRYGGFEYDPGLTNLARWDMSYRARPHVREALAFERTNSNIVSI
jgi:glutathione S-transferase